MKKAPKSSTPQNALILGLLHDHPVAYRPDLARATRSVEAGIMLSKGLQWDAVVRAQMPERDGWFYKTIEEWEEETGLTRYNQETARRILVAELELFEQKRKGVPAKLWFRVNLDNVIAFLTAYYSGSTYTPPNSSLNSRLLESNKLENVTSAPDFEGDNSRMLESNKLENMDKPSDIHDTPECWNPTNLNDGIPQTITTMTYTTESVLLLSDDDKLTDQGTNNPNDADTLTAAELQSLAAEAAPAPPNIPLNTPTADWLVRAYTRPQINQALDAMRAEVEAGKGMDPNTYLPAALRETWLPRHERPADRLGPRGRGTSPNYDVYILLPDGQRSMPIPGILDVPTKYGQYNRFIPWDEAHQFISQEMLDEILATYLRV